MIAGMVAGLAAKLEDNPNDPEGWVMLIRSHATLGRVSEARNALQTARTRFRDDAASMRMIEQQVGELSTE